MLNEIVLKAPDGVERKFVKLSSVKGLMPGSRFKTFRTYVSSGRLPSVKVGTNRMVELPVVNNWIKEDK